MTVYVPAFETQRDQGAPLPWTNCTLASGAMLVDWWTFGRQRTNDIELRAASGIHPSLGTNFAAVRKAILTVERLDLRYSEWDASGNANISWAQLRTHLANSGGAAVAGKYGALRPFRSSDGLALDRWQPGADFGHATFVADYRPDDGSVLWMDPLGHGTYTGDRIPLEALWAFLYKSGNTEDAGVAAAYAFAGTRPTPPIGDGRVVVTALDPVWTAVFRAGSTTAGWDPDTEGVPVRAFTAPPDRNSRATIDAIVRVNQETVPRGTFLRIADGVLAGLLVTQTSVTVEKPAQPLPAPEPTPVPTPEPDPVHAAYLRGFYDARTAATAAAGKVEPT